MTAPAKRPHALASLLLFPGIAAGTLAARFPQTDWAPIAFAAGIALAIVGFAEFVRSDYPGRRFDLAMGPWTAVSTMVVSTNFLADSLPWWTITILVVPAGLWIAWLAYRIYYALAQQARER